MSAAEAMLGGHTTRQGEEKDAFFGSVNRVETGIGYFGGCHSVVPYKRRRRAVRRIRAHGALPVCPLLAVVLTALAGLATSRRRVALAPSAPVF